jgi:hypothetical protein
MRRRCCHLVGLKKRKLFGIDTFPALEFPVAASIRRSPDQLSSPRCLPKTPLQTYKVHFRVTPVTTKNAIPMLISTSSLHKMHRSVTPEHTLHKISKRSPEVLAARKTMFIDEEDIMLETRIEVSLQPKLANYRIVVTVDMCVNTIHPLEYLTDHAWEGFWEWNTCDWLERAKDEVKLHVPMRLGKTASLSMLL